MDGDRFDRLTKQLASGTTRRRVLHGVAGGIGAAALAAVAPALAPPVRAAQAGTPAAAATVEPLLRVAFPSAVLPPAAQVWFGAGSWEPGTSLTNPPGVVAEGAGFDYVLSGTLAVSGAGPLLLARPGAEPEPVATGAEVTLGAGEAAAYLEPEATWTGRNVGEAPLEILYLAIEALAPPTSLEEHRLSDPEPGGNALTPQHGEGLGFLDATAWAELAPGPVVVTLARVTLAPGASLPPHAGPGLRLVGAPGTVFGMQGRVDEPLANAGDAPLVVYVVTLVPSGLPVGTPAATPTG